MNWNDLSLLLQVSRSSTMTETAKRLGMNQTTVSRRLDALEAALGVLLVQKRKDGIGLTDAGLDAVRSVEIMETVANDLERKLLGTDAELAGRLIVTTTDTTPHYHPDLFTGFAERYPAVHLEVDTNFSARSLARREADVALRWTLKPDGALFGRKLIRVEYALYAASELVAEVGRRSRLSSYPWLAFTAASKARVTDQWMKSNVPDATIVCRYTHTLSMYAAVRAGAGIGFMPCAYADPDPALVRLRGVQPGFGYDIWLLTHPDLSRTARVRAFLSHAGEYFDARKKLYAGKLR
jgi:DNA-binding transcriptional LysR family regulator